MFFCIFTGILQVQNNKASVPKPTTAMQEIKDWWNDQLAYESSSDED